MRPCALFKKAPHTASGACGFLHILEEAGIVKVAVGITLVVSDTDAGGVHLTHAECLAGGGLEIVVILVPAIGFSCSLLERTPGRKPQFLYGF